MVDYERTVSVDAAPEDAFRFLTDSSNLPRYVATMVSAGPREGDRLRVAAEVAGRHEEGEARVRVDEARRRSCSTCSSTRSSPPTRSRAFTSALLGGASTG